MKADAKLGPLQSYSTVRRYMVAHGMLRKPRLKPKEHPGELRAAQRRERREIRSYEAEYVGALWHLDFHHGSLQVVTPRGQWQRPLALGILDDHSRYCAHLQWYLSETAEDLVHGFSQAIQKCGLPRASMTDNGSAMLADEFTEGLLRLGILHETTLPYSPYQNGKQECLLGTSGRASDGDARQVRGTDTRLPQRSHPGLGGNRVQPPRAPRDRLFAGDAFRPGAGRAAPEPFIRRLARGVSPGSEAASAAKRRHDLARRACVSRSPAAIVTSATWWCVIPVGTSAGSIWWTRARERSWPASFPWIARPTPTVGARSSNHGPSEISASEPRESPAELPPLLRQILAEYSATGLPPAYLPKNPLHPSSTRKEVRHECQETAVAVGSEMEPVLAGTSRRSAAGDRHRSKNFAWRVEQLVQEGGFALISGESGTGKSVALRIVAERLAALRDVVVGVLERPQSKSADFYRELGDIFSVKLRPSNRWGGFNALRERWKTHVASTASGRCC